MKKIIALLMVLVLTLGCFAACKTAEEPADKPETPATETTPAPATGKLAVTIVVAGTFGDRSFYDSSKEGGERLAKDFSNLDVKFVECNGENHTVRMQNAAAQSDIVVCVGWEFYDIETVAPEFPNVKFIWIDNETSAPVPNVLNIVYAQNEGSFLAGYIAAAMSKTGTIGAVGGEDSITINDFIVGYKQGAAYFSDAVKVEVNYTNDYDDPAKGKDCAKVLHDRGADVIFQIASKAGDGVFEAAEAGGFYAIGVDSDQKYINDAVIICSMKKEVGTSIYDAIAKIVSGDNSQLGTTWVADMSNGYVGIGYGEEGSTQQVPDEIKAQVEEIMQKIVNGEIVVDTTRN
ncbi:MAG: BMP family ABC transporter substrate-binding protein [Clostridia bacterium]|nr:BMP family ABC transporter substrate-binding protein [Clostridia bacterium]